MMFVNLLFKRGQSLAEYVLRQTRVAYSMISKLKLYVARESSRLGHRVLLQDIYEQAVVEFMEHRMELQKEDKKIIYLASPARGEGSSELNMKLPDNLAFRVTRIAEADHTSDRRFLYTSLVRFCKTHGIDKIEVYNGN